MFRSLTGFSSILVNPWNNTLRCDDITYYDNINRRNPDTILIRRVWFVNASVSQRDHVLCDVSRGVANMCI